jgi:hypothetical protein
MRAMIRALDAERLKTKRTLALWLAIIIPLSVVGLQFLAVYQRGAGYFRQDGDPWSQFGRDVFLFFALLMYPLFVALETALLGSLEHRSGQWKYLWALPLPRWAIYAAKQVAGMTLIGLSLGLLVVLTALVGVALQVLRPGIGLSADVPWKPLLKFGAGIYVASWLLISIHTWIGIRWQNFALAMGVGVVATVFALATGDSGLASINPWSVPAVVIDTLTIGKTAWMSLLWGGLGGVTFGIWACRDIARRDVL